MEEQTISWNTIIYPDMEAIAKRDAFLSDENGMHLQEILNQFHSTKDVLTRNGGDVMQSGCLESNAKDFANVQDYHGPIQ